MTSVTLLTREGLVHASSSEASKGSVGQKLMALLTTEGNDLHVETKCRKSVISVTLNRALS